MPATKKPQKRIVLSRFQKASSPESPDSSQGSSLRLSTEESQGLLRSFWDFCVGTRVLDKLEEQPHKEMCDELESCIPVLDGSFEGIKKEIYLAPRGSYKTSLVKAFMIYCYLRYPNIRIVYGRATADAAKDVLRSTKDMMMDNPVIRSTWGDFKELSNVWTDEKIVLARPDAALTDATIAITSLGKNMTGFHPDLIILDDLVTDENYQSERALERCQILLQGCFPVLQKGGSLIVCGTRWSYSDIYGWLMDQDADAEAEERRQAEASHRAPRPIDKWKVYVRSVYNDDGSLFFPKVLSEGFLSSQKHNLRQQMMLFSSWYYNLPYEEGTKLFDTKSLIYFEAEYWRSPGNHLQFEDGTIVPLYVTMTIDPAPTVGPDSDFTGLSVVGTDYNGTWHVLWAEAIKKLPSRAADHVVALIIKFSPSIIAIETGQADPEFVDRIRTRLQEVGMNAPIVSYSANKDEVHGSRGKGQRIEALEPYFREGLVKLRRGIPLRDLLQQLDRYGAGLKHDDVIDALAMQRIYARPCREKTRQDLDSKLEQREEALSWGPQGPEVAARRVSPGAWIGRSSQYLR